MNIPMGSKEGIRKLCNNGASTKGNYFYSAMDNEAINKSFDYVLDDFQLTKDISIDSYNLLVKHNCNIVAEHTLEVVKECRRLAKRFGINEKEAEVAGYLHDISAIYPFNRRVEVAERLEIEILDEERRLPLILHQKISKVMAEKIWCVDNEHILNAIGCHTTLRENPSNLDLVLFVADKIKWDQKGIPPYLYEVERGLDSSLKKGAYAYINYLMENKDKLKVIHPWLAKAYKELGRKDD